MPLNKKGKGNKKLKHKLCIEFFVSYALVNDDLQVPYLVLSLIHMHRWKTLGYIVS
jgi:hypothetical protein